MNPIPKFTDESELWFGRYKGQKLANVPAGYLIWWYTETLGQKLKLQALRLREYIKENWDVLEKENETQVNRNSRKG